MKIPKKKTLSFEMSLENFKDVLMDRGYELDILDDPRINYSKIYILNSLNKGKITVNVAIELSRKLDIPLHELIGGKRSIKCDVLLKDTPRAEKLYALAKIIESL